MKKNRRKPKKKKPPQRLTYHEYWIACLAMDKALEYLERGGMSDHPEVSAMLSRVRARYSAGAHA